MNVLHRVWARLPLGLKQAGQQLLHLDERRRGLWVRDNPYSGTADELHFEGSSPYTVGIVFEFAHYHRYFMMACHDLDISYKVIDIRRSDWIEQVQSSGCDLFLAWPSGYMSAWKQMYDNRLRVLADELGKQLLPDLRAMWYYESKYRVHDWLVAHQVPSADTHVFYTRTEAEAYLRQASYPLVFKTDIGAASAGVTILRTPKQAVALARKLFASGIVLHQRNLYERQLGSMLVQEYLPNSIEWRMVRIGDRYFCRRKVREGEFYSGGGRVEWARPPEALLDATKDYTDRGGFTNINVDYFETTDGRFLVNELHAVFGDIRPTNRDHGRELMGWWQKDESGEWSFTHGYAYKNACANLRLYDAVSSLYPNDFPRIADWLDQLEH